MDRQIHLPERQAAVGQRDCVSVLEQRFLIEDWHNSARTTTAPDGLVDNFEPGLARPAEKYGERFYRMWKYYLMSCAGFSALARDSSGSWSWEQDGKSGVYRSVR